MLKYRQFVCEKFSYGLKSACSIFTLVGFFMHAFAGFGYYPHLVAADFFRLNRGSAAYVKGDFIKHDIGMDRCNEAHDKLPDGGNGPGRRHVTPGLPEDRRIIRLFHQGIAEIVYLLLRQPMTLV